jgi:hypothetical protein
VSGRSRTRQLNARPHARRNGVTIECVGALPSTSADDRHRSPTPTRVAVTSAVNLRECRVSRTARPHTCPGFAAGSAGLGSMCARCPCATRSSARWRGCARHALSPRFRTRAPRSMSRGGSSTLVLIQCFQSDAASCRYPLSQAPCPDSRIMHGDWAPTRVLRLAARGLRLR